MKEILEIGYPRNDLLVCENKDKIAFSVRNQLGLAANKKLFSMRQPGAMMSLSEKEPIVLPIICQLNNF